MNERDGGSGELRAGYKQSEVGVIPEDWSAEPLKGKLDLTHGYAFEGRYFGLFGEYRLTTPGHFYETGGFRELGDKQKYYSGPVPGGYFLEPDDLIVAMTEQAEGLLGSAALVPQVGHYLHNQRIGRAKLVDRKTDKQFLFHLFNAPQYRAKVRETAAGTKVKHTSPEKLLEIRVPLPPLAEQRAIAAALSDVDALIGALDRLIAKKRDLKQATMQQLLTGQTRLPGFGGKWAVSTIGELGSWFSGGTPSMSTEAYWLGNIPWVSPKDMKVSRLHDAIDHVCEKAIGAGTRLAPAGTIFVVVRGMILAHSMPVARIETPMAFNQDVKALVVSARHESDFVLWWLTAHKDLLLSKTTESTHGTKRLPTEELFEVRIALPNTEEQRAIAAVLTDMDAELTAVEARREKTRLLKQSMMQELLTGKTRLV